MKKIIFLLANILIITLLSFQVVLADNKAENLSDNIKLELLALSKLSYEIPSKSFWSLGYDNKYEIICKKDIRVFESNGDRKKLTITVSPQDFPISSSDAFNKYDLSYKISIYDSNGVLIKHGNNNKSCLARANYMCKSKNFEKKDGYLSQWYVHYDEFKITLPTSSKKTKFYVVFESSSNNVFAELKVINGKIQKPNNSDLSIINNTIFYNYFEDFKPNSNVTSSEFINKIHPGKMFMYNNKAIYWTSLIKQKLKDYSYLGNNEDTDIVGSGFYAVSFMNNKNNTIVIAYRGTELTSDINDIVNDLIFGITPFKSPQINYAKQYYELIKRRYPDHNIILTGHSLGGTLANSVTFEYAATPNMVSYSPGGITQIQYSDTPISVGFNAATFYILDTYKKNIVSSNDNLNYINIITDKEDMINDVVVGGPYLIRLLNKISSNKPSSVYQLNSSILDILEKTKAMKYIERRGYSSDIDSISKVSDGVHGLPGLVSYDGSSFKLSPKYTATILD